MTPAAALRRLLRLPRLRGPVVARPVRTSARRRARPVIVWFAVAFVGLNAVALLAMDVIFPQLRDPEYGRRVERLKDRLAEHPNRPLVLVVGSSRAAMGVRPDVWEATRPNGTPPDPLLFNLSIVGSGPLIELLALQRAYADGIRPAAVILEYWPPFLREDGPYFEPYRIDDSRLFRSDRGFVRTFCKEPDRVERRMLTARLNPLSDNRHRWLAQALPSWLPWTRRLDVGWQGIDEWGWLPGLDDEPAKTDMRAARLAHCEGIYREQFAGYTVHPLADRGLRETVALARSHGAKVGFVYLPEASEFRGWYPPAVEQTARDHLAALCRELGTPVIDGRLWLADEYLVDGFHLSRAGAAEFMKRFGPAVAELFPDLERRP